MTKRMKTIGIIGLFVVLVGAVLAFRIYEFNNPQVFYTNEALQQEFGVPVEVAAVERRDIIDQEAFTGTIEGFSQTEVRSEVSQKVIALKVRVGSRVSRHDTIAVLDTKSVSNANLRYVQTAANYEDAELNFQRMKNLYDAGAISKQQLDQARLNYDVQKANYEAVMSAVYVESPIDGMVTETHVEPGDQVSVNQPIAKVVRFDKVKIKIPVNESDIGRVRNGQSCIVTTASLAREFNGNVSEISLSADPRTRNFEVTVTVDNPELLLRAGMFANVRIILDRRSKVLAIDKDALINNGGDLYVYTVSSDNAIARKPVSVGSSDGTYFEVLSGLSEGEKVITEGFNNIQSDDQKAIIIQ